MTKDELLEMIDATINENGKRGITGKALNLALNEIVSAIGTSSGGGGTLSVYFSMGELTEEKKAHNATTYAACKAIVEGGGVLPCVMIDMSEVTGGLESGLAMSVNSIGVGFDTIGSTTGGTPALILMEMLMLNVSIMVLEDGSLIMQEGGVSTMSLKQ